MGGQWRRLGGRAVASLPALLKSGAKQQWEEARVPLWTCRGDDDTVFSSNLVIESTWCMYERTRDIGTGSVSCGTPQARAPALPDTFYQPQPPSTL